MTPVQQTDLTILQGTTWSKGWLVSIDGEAIDDTWTARSQVRTSKRADAELLHTFAATVTSVGAAIISVQPDESSEWAWMKGVYDVEIVSPTGLVKRIAFGKILIDTEVTK